MLGCIILREAQHGGMVGPWRPASLRIGRLAMLVVAFAALVWPATSGAADLVTPSLVQTIDTARYSPPSPDPSGIVYLPTQDRLLIADSETDETGLYQGSNLFTATRTGSGSGSGTLLARGSLAETSKEPAGLAFKPSDATLFVSDDDRDRVSLVRPGPDGRHGSADDVVSRLNTSGFGSGDPEDVAYDTASGHLFICDGDGIEMYDVNPVNGTFGDGNDVVTHFDLAQHGLRDCEGLGIDPSTNALLAVDWRTHRIYEVTAGGALLRIFSLSNIPTSSQVQADVTMAPTSNPNDDPAALNYWIVDRHRDNNSSNPPPRDGLLYEMSLGAAPPPPPPPQRTLTVQVQGAGSGTVTGPGINCPGDCTETYDNGQAVVLAAAPAVGSSFGGWSGACSGSAPCALTMDADKQATATFNSSPPPPPPQRTLTVQVQGAGSGTVTGPGINCPGDCTETYDNGQAVVLAAAPAVGSSFGGWSGACSGSAPCALTMDADKQATATFNSSPGPPPPLFSLPIANGLDDGDETQTGSVRRTNGDLNLGSGSGGSPTTAALRFTGVQIPNGATIANAEVQFTADETGTGTSNLTIRAERAANSAAIGSAAFNISSRPRTNASVGWPVPAWPTVGASGTGQLTPNLASVIQEVVSLPGWAPGNALTVIINGTGRRAAESFEGGAPPVLRVAFVGL